MGITGADGATLDFDTAGHAGWIASHGFWDAGPQPAHLRHVGGGHALLDSGQPLRLLLL